MKTLLQMKTLIVMLILCSLSHSLHAQDVEVVGVVSDELGPLPGVNIAIIGTSKGTISDLDGSFRLSGIEGDSAVLVMSYLGYENMEFSIGSQSGQMINLGEIKMKSGSTHLDEIVIKGSYMSSQQKALNMKKNSLGIMEVLASDAIGKLPDRNAAEAVQRVSGVSIERDHGEGRYVIVRGTPIAWNSTLMNGDRMPSTEGTSDNTGGTRAAPLDIFPSEMIEFVQVSKAITPDMEGDAIGGSVNFITRTAPKRKTLNLNLGYGYNNQAQQPIQSASMVYGDRIADGKFGYLISGTYWNRNWGTDNIEVVYSESNQAVEELQLRDYLGQRTTYGFNGGMEYQPKLGQKLYVRGLYTDFQDRESAVEHLHNFADGELGLRIRHGIIGINLYGGEIGGNHDLGSKVDLNWKFSTYSGDMESRALPNSNAGGDPAYLMATFSAPVDYQGLTADGYKFLDIDAPAGYNGDSYDNIQPRIAGSDWVNSLSLDNQIAFQSFSQETDFSGQIDLGWEMKDNIKWKTGLKLRHMDLKRGAPYDYHIFLGSAYNAPINLGDMDRREFPERGGFLTELGQPYDGQILDPISLAALHDLFTAEQLSDDRYYSLLFDENDATSAGSFYSGTEQVMAGYLMADWDITPRLKAVGGVRYEHSTLEYKGKVTTMTDDKTTIEDQTNDNDFGSLLPMVHLKYRPSDNLNLKLAVTRSMARANFSELNPTESVVLVTSPYTIIRGNINLEPTYSQNFDIIGEYFLDDVGLISAGLFYKSLKNVIYTARSFQTIDGENYQITQPQNSEDGWLAGFEMGLSKRFSGLPGILSGLGFEGNYTFADSEMKVPEYSVHPNTGAIEVETTEEKIPNQSKHLFNAAVFYEKGGLTLRLAGNYKGSSLAVVQGNPENYRWYDENFTLDLSTSFSISKRLKFYLEINNLTNEPLRYYQGSPNRPEQLEYYSLRGMVGLNYKLY